jgi:Rieske Fe-S protein
MNTPLTVPAAMKLPVPDCSSCRAAMQRGQPEASSWGRRSFLKATARAVLLVEASGLPWAELFAPAARAADPVGVVRVALTDFPTLSAVSGSVHLVVAAPTPLYPVILTRTAANTFAAVSSQCTHSGCVVNTFSDTEGSLLCNCHGSRFTAQGVVINGPAGFDLTGYPARLVSAGVVEVEISGIGFALAGALVNTAVGRRMRLTFPTSSGLRYEIRRRGSLTTAAVAVPFSLTETGAANQMALTGDGAPATVHVEADAATGFLSVARS